jgi:hypothetical protein
VTRRTEQDATQFGFRWGQMDVLRLGEFPSGHKVIGVETDFGDLQIYVSKTGRRIRVFRDGKELR